MEKKKIEIRIPKGLQRRASILVRALFALPPEDKSPPKPPPQKKNQLNDEGRKNGT